MAFESLINKPMPEQQLLDLIVSEVQRNYILYQDKKFFIKLSKTEDKLSSIAWIKTFTCTHELMDFYHDTKFKRACIMIRSGSYNYALLCQGHFISDFFEILTDKIINSHPYESIENRESYLKVPRELTERAFGEISQALVSIKRIKTM